MDGVSSSIPQVHPVRYGTRARRPARLASVVVEELAERIVTGALAEGAMLPNEPALVAEFGFSRTVIREALKLLEERGLVRVEQGRGTSVQPRASWNLLDPVVLRLALAHDHDLALLDDLIAVRRLLEREMARAAVVRLTDDDIATLSGIVDQLAASLGDQEQFRQSDLAFHATVMRISGSEIGRTVVGTIHRFAGQAPRLNTPGERASLERTVAEHRASSGRSLRAATASLPQLARPSTSTRPGPSAGTAASASSNRRRGLSFTPLSLRSNRRPRRQRPDAQAPRYRHGLPELRPLPAPLRSRDGPGDSRRVGTSRTAAPALVGLRELLPHAQMSGSPSAKVDGTSKWSTKTPMLSCQRRFAGSSSSNWRAWARSSHSTR